MLGAVVGDTAGSIYEFENTHDYNFPFYSESSIYTDDSILSFAIAEWLLNDSEHSLQTLEDSLVKMTKAFPSPMGGYGPGYRIWVFNPERSRNYDPSVCVKPNYTSTTGRHPYGSCGNGSAMRASALGWFFPTLEETERVAELSALVTHNHVEGIKGAQATAAAIWMGRNGKSKDEIRDYIESRFGYDLHKTYSYWQKAYEWDSTAQGTVPQALICFLESTSFEDAIRKGVALGGDSDTLTCIVGGIAEAFYHGVPPELAQPVLNILPESLLNLLKQLQERTDYGKICPIQFNK